MARVLKGSQFYLHTPRSSANEMNHTCSYTVVTLIIGSCHPRSDVVMFPVAYVCLYVYICLSFCPFVCTVG